MAPHLALLDREINNVFLGKTKRLLVQMPPRHGKSELTSRYSPANYIARFPDRKIIFGSATEDLANQFSGFARDQIAEHGGQFGVRLGTRTAAGWWNTNKGGEVRAVGVGGSIYGFGAHIIIIDDYCKSIESALSLAERDMTHRWFQGSIRNRLESEHDGAIIIVATPYHIDDLRGRLLKEQELGGDVWRVVSLPALALEGDLLGRQPGEALWSRWSREHLLKEQRAYSVAGYPWMFDALYQCQPTEVLTSEFPGHYFADHIWFDHWPDPQDIAIKVIAVDPSLGKTDKSDYSAITMLAVDRNGVCWADLDLGRRPGSIIARDTIARYEEFKPIAIGCESNLFQELMSGEFDRASGERISSGSIWFIGINNQTNKRVRIRSLDAILSTKSLRLKRGSPGCNLLVEQLRGFPQHKHDDGPDSLEMAVRMAREIMEGAVSK